MIEMHRYDITCTWHLNYGCIPTNLSKTKSGTKSLKKRDFWSKIGTFLRILQKLAKIIKLIGTTVHKNIAKKVGSPLCIVYQEKQHGFVASIRGLSCHALEEIKGPGCIVTIGGSHGSKNSLPSHIIITHVHVTHIYRHMFVTETAWCVNVRTK